MRERMALWFLGLGVVFCCFFVTTHRLNLRKNWHLPTGSKEGTTYWMSQDATMDIYMPWDETMIVSFALRSYQRQRTLQLFVNGLEQSKYQISPMQKTSLVIVTPLAQGVNTLTFHAEPGCDFSWETSEFRCLSFALSMLQVSTLQAVEALEEVVPALAKTAELIRYDAGWFDREHDGERTWRYMTVRAALQVFGGRSKQGNRIMDVKLRSVHSNGGLQVSVGDEVVFEGEIPRSLTEVRFALPAEVQNPVVTFVSKNGCQWIRDVGNQPRCVSFSVEGITIERTGL